MSRKVKPTKNQDFQTALTDPAADYTLVPQKELLKYPTDWWQCLRFGPVSGRYEGEMTAPDVGKYLLDLRVDIDVRHANSPVMNRVSGDLYQMYNYTWGTYKYKWRVYKESWIIDNPTVKWSSCSVKITGNLRFWTGFHLITSAEIVIPWSGGTIGPATVKISSIFSSASSVYSCTKKSNAFREVKLEVDICSSVNTAPILPEYDTDDHNNRPVDLPQRVLTIEESYQEAGIDMTINPSHSIIDDSDSQFTTWSPAELHDAMEQYFSQYAGTWPKWHMWCLLAGTFQSSSVGGIMFDAAAAYGGAGDAPDRQGCAVFRNHSWFNSLVQNPSTQTQAAAMRKYLYTYVHEIGHAFNFLHSWDKSRPDALSWMNYDWKYDNRNGSGTFWGNFRMRFDDEELIHMRHGNRASVIMGADPWASGGHMEEPGNAMSNIIGNAPVELSVKSKGYYQFMEPVSIELRVKNISELPLNLDTQLHPEFGGVVIYIQRPDGKILQYAPVLCKIATPELKILQPLAVNLEGNDRHSQNVFLSFGSDGFYFNEPGEYAIRAVYQGDGSMLIPSNLHRITIGRPFSREEEKTAQDFFNNSTGMALYLNGSASPFLKSAMDTLEEVANKYEKSPLGAQVSLVLAKNLSAPFYRIKDNKMVKEQDAKPAEALSFTEKSLNYQKAESSTFQNIDYHDLRKVRTDLLVSMGKTAEAKNEVKELVSDLKKRGVNQPVLDTIKAYTKGL
ncbi:hypothetical protein [Maribellus sediminis]|uniref:hypothetical protein n=1 Tax=Maribellus sediminis TaxID=2696285 RepID=UPI0014319839|nr:hypothetical protein [Maribellus sediminis]